MSERGSLFRDRYRVTFTPAGWQVIDTEIAGDPLYEFGTGPEEYKRAKDEADRLNKDYRTSSPLHLRGES